MMGQSACVLSVLPLKHMKTSMVWEQLCSLYSFFTTLNNKIRLQFSKALHPHIICSWLKKIESIIVCCDFKFSCIFAKCL
ncbi:hypothetical protein XELAEV_18003800mg [Xenopus laevis]|nr:hypothetical protein XELAEV_18003800mg [Xenopus laevis]